MFETDHFQIGISTIHAWLMVQIGMAVLGYISCRLDHADNVLYKHIAKYKKDGRLFLGQFPKLPPPGSVTWTVAWSGLLVEASVVEVLPE